MNAPIRVFNHAARAEYDRVLKELEDTRLERDQALKRLSTTQTAIRHALAEARGDLTGRRSGAPRRAVLAPEARPLPDGGGL